MAKKNTLYDPWGYREQPILIPKDDCCDCDLSEINKVNDDQTSDIEKLRQELATKLPISAFTEYSGETSVVINDIHNTLNELAILIEETSASTNNRIDVLSGEVKTLTAEHKEDVEKLLEKISINSGDITNVKEIIEEIQEVLETKGDSTIINEKLIELSGAITSNTERIGELDNAINEIKDSLEDELGNKVNIDSFNTLSGKVEENSTAIKDTNLRLDDVNVRIDNLEVVHDDFATRQWVEEQGYLKEHQSLEDYATKAELEAYNRTNQEIIASITKNIEGLNTSVTEINTKIDNINASVDELKDNAATKDDIANLNSRFDGYNESLADILSRVNCKVNQIEFDILASTVSGLTKQVENKLNKADFLVLKEKVNTNTEDIKNLKVTVNDTLPVAIEDLSTRENNHYNELLSKLSAETASRINSDELLSTQIEDAKQEAIGEAAKMDGVILQEAKDYALEGKKEVLEKVLSVEELANSKVDAETIYENCYKKPEIDEKLLNLRDSLSGAVNTRVDELTTLIEGKDKEYDEKFGEKITDLTTRVTTLEDQYAQTKDEVHVLNEIILGGDGGVEHIKELLEKLENLNTDSFATKDDLEAMKTELTEKSPFKVDENNTVYLENTNGKRTITIEDGGDMKLDVEDEMMSINELLGQLAHSTY